MDLLCFYLVFIMDSWSKSNVSRLCIHPKVRNLKLHPISLKCGMACHAESSEAIFSVPYCLLLDGLIKETTCNIMIDQLQSRGTPWRQCVRHVKVRGILSKMDV